MSQSWLNEIDAFAASWLRNLIDVGETPQGVVDERSIVDIHPNDVRGYQQCHFFAGIGGWPLALRLAGWPESVPVWTGSCPCQPFSSAGKRQGEADERHLWPQFFRLICKCKPPVVFGEQVASSDGLRWLDGVCVDLEGAGYAVGSADMCAAGVGAPHIRQRLFWVAYANELRHDGRQSAAINGKSDAVETQAGGIDCRLADANGTESRCGELRFGETSRFDSGASCWQEFTIIPCRDGKARRVGRSVQPLAYGVPTRRSDPRMGFLIAELGKLGHSAKDARRILRKARSNRNGRLRGYGNAIVPQVAAAFIKAFMETMGIIDEIR